MPDNLPDVQTVLADPNFHALDLSQKAIVLMKIDPNFAGLPAKERAVALNGIHYGGPTQFEKDRTPAESNLSQGARAFGSDVVTAVKGIPALGQIPIHPIATIEKAATAIGGQYKASRAAGHGIPYSTAAGASTAVGVDVPGMEHEADLGRTGGIVGKAILPAAAAALPELAKAVGKGAFPAARATKAFDEVEAVAGTHPVDIVAPSKAAINAEQVAASGGHLPKVIGDFINRVTDPHKPPLTFSEARQFYVNATALSDAEKGLTNSVMRRQVAMFTSELGQAIKATANNVGKLSQFQEAMQAYRTSKNISRAAEIGKKAAITAAGVGLAEKLYKSIK